MPKFIIKSVGESFRRAGIGFTREGVEIDTDELSEEQLQAINDEPRLTVWREVTEDGKQITPEGKPGQKPKLSKVAKGGKAK